LERQGRFTPTRRLQLILVLLAAWDLLGFVVPLLADSFLFGIDGELDGILAGRVLSGAIIVPAVLYLYAARRPERYRGILWVAVIEQLVAIVTGVFHLAAGTVGLGEVVIPLAVAVAFLIVVLLNFPTGPKPVEAESA
jgi:hypothetical protein